MFNDKKGKSKNILLSFLLVLIILGIVLYIFDVNLISLVKGATDSEVGYIPIVEVLKDTFDNPQGATGNAVALFGTILGFVIGGVPNNMIMSSTALGSVIVLICIWLMFILAFGDILKNFSSFSDKISWSIAILLGIAAANLKVIGGFAAILTTIFAGLGVFAIYAGLFASIIAFFVVDWGIGGLAPWVMRRKSMQESVKSQESTDTILNAIRSYKRVGEELAEKN